MTRQRISQIASQNLFRELRREVWERTRRPVAHPSFIFFFLVAVLGFSALGIWLELYAYIYPDPTPLLPQPTDALRTSILTFFPAVAGTAAMQLIWAESTKHFRSAAFCALVIFLVAALWISPSRISNASAVFVGVIASLLSMWVWWIANAKQADLLDKIDPAAPVGGDDISGNLPGSLDEYQH